MWKLLFLLIAFYSSLACCAQDVSKLNIDDAHLILVLKNRRVLTDTASFNQIDRGWIERIKILRLIGEDAQPNERAALIYIKDRHRRDVRQVLRAGSSLAPATAIARQ